jgi:hypothetical protein
MPARRRGLRSKPNQWVLYFWRSASLSTKGSVFSGRKKSGGLLRKVSPKKARKGDSDHGERLRVNIEDAADDGRIGSVLLLP